MREFGPYDAKVARVIDGDTVVVDVKLRRGGHGHVDRDLGFNIHARPDGLWLVDTHVRLHGCNAAEKGTPAGDAATAWLTGLLPPGLKVSLSSFGWDKFGGRVQGSIAIPGLPGDVTAALIAAGHAQPWDGKGPRPV